MYNDCITAASVDGMCDVAPYILNVFLVIFLFFVEQILILIIFVLLFFIQSSVKANVIIVLPKFLPSNK